MLLACDIGNTNIVLGVHANNVWQREWRLESVPGKTADEYRFLINGLFLESTISAQAIDQAVISCVVPALLPVFEDVLSDLIGTIPLIVHGALDLPISIDTRNPMEVGADIISNAVAAYAQAQKHDSLKHGGLLEGQTQSAIAVDFGTALTFTAVDKTAIIRGAAIAPGLRTALKALAGGTAQLPEVPLKMPSDSLGKDTTTSIQAGVVLGYTKLVEGLIERIKADLGQGPAYVVATGGLSKILVPHLTCFDQFDPLLTLEGLRLICEHLT